MAKSQRLMPRSPMSESSKRNRTWKISAAPFLLRGCEKNSRARKEPLTHNEHFWVFFFPHLFSRCECVNQKGSRPRHLSFSVLGKNVTCFASPYSPSIKNNFTHFSHLCLRSTKPRSQRLCEDNNFPQTARFSLRKRQILKNCKLI